MPCSPLRALVLPCLFTLSALSTASTAAAQNQPFQVVTVPWAAASPTVPYDAVDGQPFLFPAVARGACNEAIRFRWDFDGDGTWDTALADAPNAWNLGARYTYPAQAESRTFTARVEARCGAVVTTAEVPVRVHVGATTGQRVNRAIAHGLWWLHTQLGRDTNARTAWLNGVGAAYMVPAAGEAAHAFSVLGHGAAQDPATDPYAEDARWLVHYLATRMQRRNIAGQPDASANGYGLRFDVLPDCDVYCGGSGLAGMVAFGGYDEALPAGLGPAEVAGHTPREVIRETMEYFHSTMNLVNWWNYPVGGWKYPATSNRLTDSSQTAWMATVFLAARLNAGLAQPQWVKDRFYGLVRFNENNRDAAPAGSWGYNYFNDCTPGNVARSAGMVIVDSVARDANRNDAYAAAGLAYIGARFDANIEPLDICQFILQVDVHPATGVNVGNYYAMYQVAKAAKAFDPPVELLGAQNVDWYARYADFLVRTQEDTGRWANDVDWMSGQPYMVTSLGLLVLSPSPHEALPVAVARAESLAVGPGDPVRFDHSASYARDPSVPLVRFRWNFVDLPGDDANGDGVVSKAEIRFEAETQDPAERPEYRFGAELQPGQTATYRVALQVEDARGRRAWDTDALRVVVAFANHPPVVVSHPSGDSETAYEVPRGGRVTLDASRSYDPDAGQPPRGGFPADAVTSVHWDLDGDGTFETAGAAVPFTPPPAWAPDEDHRVPVRICDDGRWVGRDDAACGGDCSLCAVGSARVRVLPNAPPEVRLEPASLALDEGGAGRLDASASADPEGTDLVFDWLCDAGLEVAAAGPLADVTVPETTDAPAAGLAVACTLVVTDALGAQASVEIPVQVSPAPPVITAVRVEDTDEGSPARLTIEATSVAAADRPGLRYGADCDDDGWFEVVGQARGELFCSFPDSGSYTATVQVTDDDEGETVERAPPLTVRNLPPRLVAPPCPQSREGVPLRLPFAADDPAGAADPITCALVAPVPEGARLAAGTCTVQWLPTASQAAAGAPVGFTVSAADDDGGSVRASTECRPAPADTDGDGLSDAFEVENGLDPTQDDCARDADGDGVDNCTEIARGTDPFAAQAAPGTPVLRAPIDDAIVETLTPTLDLAHAAVVGQRARFLVFADAAGAALLAVSEPVPAAGAETRWVVPDGPLPENERAFWTAELVVAGLAGLRPALASFRVNAFPEPPGPPRIVAPEDGRRVPDRRPVLLLDNAVDPDPEDSLRYVCEIATDSAFETLVSEALADEDPSGRTSLRVLDALAEGVQHHARCRAIDADELSGPWSASVAFTVDSNLRAPAAPEIVHPAHEAEVEPGPVTFEVRNVAPPNGEPLTYHFWLSDAAHFPPASTREADRPAGPEGLTAWDPGAPLAAGVWFWRVRAADSQVAGPMSTARFAVVAPEPPPLPDAAVPPAPDAGPPDAPLPDALQDPDALRDPDAATDAPLPDAAPPRDAAPPPDAAPDLPPPDAATDARPLVEADADPARQLREVSGAGCDCRVGARAPLGASWPFLALLLLALRRRRPARAAFAGALLLAAACGDSTSGASSGDEDTRRPPPGDAAPADARADGAHGDVRDATPPARDQATPADAPTPPRDALADLDAPEDLDLALTDARPAADARPEADARPDGAVPPADATDTAPPADAALPCETDEPCPEGHYCDEDTQLCTPGCRLDPDDCPPEQRCDPHHVCVLRDPCRPSEICDNGLDDDCNGLIDDPEVCNAGCRADRPCRTGAIGVCGDGLTTCPDGPLGEPACVATGVERAESCNGLDDDCDGETDEDFPGLGVPCEGGLGACAGQGRMNCAGDGRGTACGFDHVRAPERCNGLDDDCDGLVDQTFPQVGRTCTLGVGACAVEGTWTCSPDGVRASCSATAGAPGPERCNGLDDDCDGLTDEDWPALGTACASGLGTCAREGLRVCTADGAGAACSVTAGPPAPEECNGLDDDCDGALDEDADGAPLENPCYDGPPDTEAVGLCRAGASLCLAGDWSECLDQVTPADEACNGLDDDCDGAADEPAPGDDVLTVDCYGGPAGTAGVGACQPGRATCQFGLLGPCTGERRPVREICDGRDDDCDGTPDDGLACGCAAGSSRACYAGPAGTRDVGACRGGTQICAADGSAWGPCEGQVLPDFEACNGLDDNCDGAIDEGAADAAACTVGVGACAARGTATCDPAQGLTCDATPGVPAPETCNGRDDDCDGLVDDGPSDVGEACAAGRGACRRDGTTTCRQGAEICLVAEPGLPSPEVCNGLDDDCDGPVDESAEGTGAACRAGQGSCARDGRVTCRAGALVCDATPGTPRAELCNGLDDDCDGLVDDGAGEVSCGLGVCRHTIPGCGGGQPAACDPFEGASPEVCNGLDDDCDGPVDEGIPGLGAACTAGLGSCRALGVTTCRDGVAGCDAVAGQPDEETCNGLDDDCDGRVDDDPADISGACTSGVGACARDGQRICRDGRPACDAVAGAPGAEICNQRDDDCDGAVDEGEVCPDVTPPDVVIRLSANPVGVGEAVTITVISQDDRGVPRVTVTVNGEPLALDANGQALFTPPAPGRYEVVVVAEDAAGLVTTREATIRTLDPNDAEPPVVRILSPDEDTTLTERMVFTGDVDDPNLLGWELAWRPESEDEYVVVASGETPVANGPIGALEPGQMENGLYRVRLTATDFNGLSASVERPYLIDGEAKVGNVRFTVVDLAVSVGGLPLTVERTYDSRVKTRRDFGVGWTLGVRQGRYTNNRPNGEAWQIVQGGGFFRWPCDHTAELADHVTEVRLSDQEYYRFLPRVTPTSQLPVSGDFCQVSVGFDYLEGSTPGTATLEPVGGNLAVAQIGRDYLAVDIDQPEEVYRIEQVRLTTPDGRVLVVDHDRGVLQQAEPNGASLTIDDAGIHHSSGLEVRFERDGQGRITRMTDPQGEVRTYTYDAAGDLVSITDPLDQTVRHTYDRRHNLTDTLDPTGRRVAQQLYDDAGRLIAIIDASGNRTEYTHDPDRRVEVITNRLGLPETFEYDARGNVLRKTNAGGFVWQNTYDDRGRKLTTTDPLGGVVSQVYDGTGALLRHEDASGRVRQWTYNGRNRPLTERDHAGRVTTNVYDANNNLTQFTAPDGAVTRFEYEGGRLVRETRPDGGVWRSAYDGNGRRISETDPLGRVTRWAYDANGRRTRETRTRTTAQGPQDLVTTWTWDALGRVTEVVDPAGNRTRTEYDPRGRKSAEIDALGRRTAYEYDDLGHVTRVRFADGSERTTEYDAAGRWVRRVDEDGGVTRAEYDALDRQTRLVRPDGSELRREFDALGRIVREIDALGRATAQAYDATGHRTRRTAPDGAETTFTYDAAGNVATMTAPGGRVTRYAYDAMDRLVETTWPDGTRTSVQYDGLGRRTRETDTAGHATAFEYDLTGRLTRVTGPDGAVTVFAYDEVGNLVSATDANGHITRHAYDATGRLISTTRPLGQTDRFEFDARGNLVGYTNGNGLTIRYTFDARNRPVRRTLPEGDAETMTWSPAGRRLTVGDARGLTRAAYDAAGRLIRLTDPNGVALDYGYDAAGQLATLTRGAAVTRYGYDAAGRLASVTDPAGQATRYAWSPNGELSGIERPNGLLTDLEHDVTGRLVRAVTEDAAGAAVASFVVLRDAAGRAVRIDEEHADRTVTYTYDAASRLTREADGARIVDYAYDAVGNRVRRTEGAAVVDNTYDANDRLVRSGTRTYEWDDAGNLLRRTDGGRRLDLGWDSRNRLVSADDGAAAAGFRYDADGNRVERAAGGAVTRYVTDTNRPFPVVVAETDAAGAELGSAVHGLGPVSLSRGGQRRYPLTDPHDSVRLLTDAAGRVTDTLDFDAWGAPTGRTGAFDSPLGWRGEAFDDDLGLVYLRARWLDPSQGRFLSVDPHRGLPSEPGTLHRYAYALGDPVNRMDPGGDFSMVSVTTSIGVISTLSTIASFGTFFIDKKSQEQAALNDNSAHSAWFIAGGLAIVTAKGVSSLSDDPGGSIYGGRADAVRHCTWNALMTAALGPAIAETLANAHELDYDPPDPNEANDKAMDLHNNAVGRSGMSALPGLPLPLRWIGSALAELAAWPVAAAQCITAVEDGSLMTLDKSGEPWSLVPSNTSGIP